MDDAMVCKSLALGYAQFLCIGVSSDILLSLSPGTPWFLYRIPQYNNTSCNFRCCWKSKEVLWRYWNYSNRAFNGRGNGFILWTWFNGNYSLAVLAWRGIIQQGFMVSISLQFFFCISIVYILPEAGTLNFMWKYHIWKVFYFFINVRSLYSLS